ncbi:MAG: protein kinase [Planctomycetes bacterium]|nr:protein kinase [Planctomycetota bacterium]
MSQVNKSLVAAVLAVRQGVLTADRAAEILASGEFDSAAISRVESAADEFDAGTVAMSPSLVDVIAERLDEGGDLADLGLDETTVRTLSQIRSMKPDDLAVKDTLLSISPTRLVRDMDLEDLPVIDASEHEGTETGHPTVRPQDKVTTRKPSSQILRAVARSERYDIEKEHARGGMGRILLARDNVIGREVALKELLPSRTRGASTPAATEDSRGLTERFLREAKVTGQLEHPNIVSVYEIGKNDDGSLYYTMKFVRGQNLEVRLREIEKDETLDKKGKLSARLKLLDSFVDVCNAIAYAHSKGVIHRDLKPENVMLGEYGETIVLDWGLARVKGQEDTVAEKLIQTTRYMSQSVMEGDSEKLTLDGSIVGTPAYMSPEQARGELDEIDEQSDVYALGAVLYQVLSGRPPYQGPVAGLIIQQVLNAKPLRLSAVAPDCPPELEALVERAMAKEKRDRLAGAREMADEIKAFRDGRTLASYSYSARELAWRWVSRHKRAVIVATVFFYMLIAGAVFHYAQLREEKNAVEDAHARAEDARKDAEIAFADARSAQQEAITEKERAEAAAQAAQAEAAEKQRALEGWDKTLADAYAMRIRLALENNDQNAAMAFAAASLESDEHPDARGMSLSTPGRMPLLYRFSPDSASKQELFQFLDVKFSPDGRYVAAGMSDGRVWMWSLETGEVAQTLRLSDSVVHDVAFSPGGAYFAASDDSGNVKIWEHDALTSRWEFRGREFKGGEGNQRVNSLEFSPDGLTLACAGVGLRLYDIAKRAVRPPFDGPGNHDAMYMTFSPDGKSILTTSIRLDDLFLRVWDVPSGKFQRALLDQTSLNEMFPAWSPDGKVIATSTLQGQIILRDGETFRRLGILNSHTSSVLGVTFSPDSRTLVSTSADGTIRLWDVATRTESTVLSGFTDWIGSVAVSPDGRGICARDMRGNVFVWGLPRESEYLLREHKADVMDARWDRDGRRFVTAGWDGSVILWDARTLRPLRTFSVPLVQFFCADFLDDNRIVAGGSNGVRVWNAATGEQLGAFRNGEYIMDLSVPPDGRHLWVVQYRMACLHDATTFAQVNTTRRHAQLALAARVSRDGSAIATAGQDGSILVSDARTLEFRYALPGAGGTVYGLDFSPDGTQLAAGYDDRAVRVWNLAERKVVRELHRHEGIPFSVRYAPDGSLLFVSSQDRTVSIWQTKDYSPLAVLKGHTETVTRLNVSPDGQMLLSCSQDDTIRIWELGDLFIPRAEFKDLVFATTGLYVREKEFGARMNLDWPSGVENHRALLGARLRRVSETRRFRSQFELKFEGCRYVDRKGAGGESVRHYYPPRRRDGLGRPVGEAQGKVNYAAWLAATEPSLLPGFERAAVVTEVNDGQGRDTGLLAGDVIWSVEGTRVTGKDSLRDVLEALKDREDYAVEVRRFALDEKGNRLARRNAEGELLLNASGETEWEDVRQLTVRLKPGKLGVRMDDTGVMAKPFK